MKKILFAILGICILLNTYAQKTYPVNGVQDEREGIYAFINAHIIADYLHEIENGILLIKKGIIEAVGENIKIPKGALVIDLQGKYIYPSFIDIYTDYGLAKPKKEKSNKLQPQMISKKKGAYGWNQAIKPEYNAYKNFVIDTANAKKLRKLGFGCVLSHQKDGIARGGSVLVTLADQRENKVVIKDKAAAHYSFNKGVSTQNYPSSLMGSIALLRQTYLDAQWYQVATATTRKAQLTHRRLPDKVATATPRLEYNISLDAWNKLQGLPQVFEVKDKLSILRADKIGDEFGIQYIIKGNGDEYQRIEEIKATNASLIIPLNFPLAYDVEDPYDALIVGLEKMKHWELAPANPAKLEKAGISFVITSTGLTKKVATATTRQDFWKNLRKAIKYGFSEKAALKALTYTPAKLLKVEDKIGSLKKGMIANFLITSTNIFDKDNIIYENWIQGKPYTITNLRFEDIRGTYDLSLETLGTKKLEVGGKLAKPTMKLILVATATPRDDTIKIKVNYSIKEDLITLSIEPAKKSLKDKNALLEGLRLSGWIKDGSNGYSEKSWEGNAQLADGTWIKWTAKRTAPYSKKDTTVKEEALALGEITYPFQPYGWQQMPQQETVLFQNATVWTNEAEGILENTDVLIKDGKISQIGKNLSAQGAKITGNRLWVINATGKHLTCGIVDEHSHIAIYKGVNEGTQSNSAEVRIGDVINSEDINIYRQLAGGVTTSQLLHGSANPVGGQSAIVKLRWGYAPEKMKLEGAASFLKFALGENVKQSNWGDRNIIRFPQTRMGVEQVYYDAFIRAREYEKKWEKYKRLSKKEKAKTIPPRKDITIETMLEILNKKRFITCHSYVQSEINMLMKVADSMGFKINIFTHILEGYKVADKMKAHGVAASTFSDWWAYKYEVIDAIPYNTAILNEMGVLTAVNSDDAEMGRRLNQEAAKAIKYGNVSEEDAWKFVTLNPAKMLHIDHKVGSIKVGKDADVVLWSDNPLSIYAKVEMTFVDGRRFFDSEQDKKLREVIQKERSRLIQKMLKEKKKGGKTQKAKPEKQWLYRCEDL